MSIKVGDNFYSKKFIGLIESELSKKIPELSETMFNVAFTSRDGLEYNYNTVSLTVIKAMIDQKEWFIGEDPFKGKK